ncbi:(Fe-S)-binding protein [Bacillus salipaludis]|uniref:Glycolate oxidase iron-sulfur subunit n=1 Tax=Bacillus salipaludis TaxID=2547811 RepID=A0AA90TVA7_9BACI|nr:(Fe-S)-binding protein [Bacillus salipaludis]MDQ6594868.1 (Fe-S)-binding protein [Bacillus salipaludis]
MSRSDRLAYEETFACVQCGYCLPKCPTYETTGVETQSPRGRINLVKLLSEEKISVEAAASSIELCLGCRACETACPTNVQYGTILQSAKEFIANKKPASKMETMLLEKGLPNKKWQKVAGRGLQFAQKTGMVSLARKSGIMKAFPESIQAMESITPMIKMPAKKEREYRVLPPIGKKTHTVGFFVGCIMDVMFSKINDDSMKLLQLAGCEVTLIEEQSCCGALLHHSGKKEETIALAKKNIAAFEHYDFDFIVNSIGGCGAMLVEYPELFEAESEWHSRAEKFAARCKDISVLLTESSLPFTKEIRKIVAYQPSCHLRHVQKVADEPHQLIKKVPGIDYRMFEKQDMCCGSAGIYNVVHYHEAMEVLDQKMNHIEKVEPDIIVTSNPGCHLQMKLGVRRERKEEKIKVVHLVELLAEACEIDKI